VIRVSIISLHGYFTHVLAAARRWRASVLLLFFIAATLVVAAPIGIALGGLSGMYWSSLVAESAIVAGMLIYLRTELGLPLRERAVGVIRELRENRTLVTFATILQITSILHLGSYFAVRYLVLARYSEAAVGLLQAAIGLVAAIGLIVNNGTTLYLSPMLNRNMAKSEKLRMAVDYQRNLALVVGALAMPIVLFSPLLLHLLYSPAFAAVSPLVFLFAAAQCLTQLAAVCQALMVGLDDLKLYGLYLGAGHLSLVALAWILAPRYGLAGVAAAYVGSGGLLFVSMLGLLIVRHGLRLPWQLPLSVVYILASIFAVGMLPLHRSISEPLLIAGKLAYYGCFVLSLLLILGQDERRYLVGRATTIRGRILWLRRAYTPGTGWRPVQDAVGPAQGDIPATEGD